MHLQNGSDGPFHILKIKSDTPWELEMKMLPVDIYNFISRQNTYKEVRILLVLIYYCDSTSAN
jgi:hypothetical protein